MIRVAALFACLLLAACGQKGNLYLPDEAKPVVVPATPESTPAPATDAANTTDEERQRKQQTAPGNAAGN